MIQLQVERLGWVLVHSLWQFALLAAMVAALLPLLPRTTAAFRHNLLVCILSLTLVFPCATWFWQANRTAPHSNPGIDVTISQVTQANQQEWLADSDTFQNQAIQTGYASESTPFLRQSLEAIAQQIRPWLGILVLIWLSGIALFSMRPMLGWLALHNLATAGLSPVPEDLFKFAYRQATRLGIQRPIRLYQSNRVSSPIVAGYFRPLILLPVGLLTGVPAYQLESLVLHELAHIRRHDFLANLIQVLVETVFFYHPCIWWLTGRIRMERELSCDDMVIQWGVCATRYSRALLAVEEMRGSGLILGLGAGEGDLLKRIKRLTIGDTMKGSDNKNRFMISSGFLLALALLSSAYWCLFSNMGPTITARSVGETGLNTQSANINLMIGGIITDPSGKPVKNARAWLAKQNDTKIDLDNWPLKAVASPAGQFEIKGSAEDLLAYLGLKKWEETENTYLQLFVDAEGFARRVAIPDVRLVPGRTLRVPPIALSPGMLIQGEIQDDQGAPLKSATIEIQIEETGTAIRIKAGTDGKFKTQQILPGERVYLTIRAPLMADKRLTLETKGEGEIQPIIAKLEKEVPIRIQICDKKGIPIEGAEVRSLPGVSKSDREGKIIIRGFSANPPAIGFRIYKEGFVEAGSYLGNPMREIVLKKAGAYEGRVVDADNGSAIKVASIKFKRIFSSNGQEGSVRLSAPDQSNQSPGHFVLPFDMLGKHRLVLIPSNVAYDPVEIELPQAADFEKVDIGEIKLKIR